ncbi:hypothetical protein [Jiangella sp. DSM 45060]|uniref:hypothetical protein n=1 Tax=Jiangella sp. DSM 45060 TaxID=1798224 RepID=UPI00087CD2E4|nr:hypothetical protein [Jiangella sp. DSM 45060]SDT70604.1 hypothetical protein SAMN04515669_6232 [Jiangella sp. DSM 45060]
MSQPTSWRLPLAVYAAVAVALLIVAPWVVATVDTDLDHTFEQQTTDANRCGERA